MAVIKFIKTKEILTTLIEDIIQFLDKHSSKSDVVLSELDRARIVLIKEDFRVFNNKLVSEKDSLYISSLRSCLVCFRKLVEEKENISSLLEEEEESEVYNNSDLIDFYIYLYNKCNSLIRIFSKEISEGFILNKDEEDSNSNKE